MKPAIIIIAVVILLMFDAGRAIIAWTIRATYRIGCMLAAWGATL